MMRLRGKRSTMHVLLVDDEPPILDLLELSLSLDGHEISRALDGAEGLRLAAERRPDLIILDTMMPGMDGLEVARRIRQDDALQSIPIIMLTAKSQETDVWRGWQSGVDSYLTKPVDLNVLRGEIERICGTGVG